jgi:hypothetical protein
MGGLCRARAPPHRESPPLCSGTAQPRRSEHELARGGRGIGDHRARLSLPGNLWRHAEGATGRGSRGRGPGSGNGGSAWGSSFRGRVHPCRACPLSLLRPLFVEALSVRAHGP